MSKGDRSILFESTVLILAALLATLISLKINATFLTSTLLFFGAPSIYLLILEKRSAVKILIAALIAGLLCGFVFDFLAEINQAWSWNGGLLFGKIAGVVQGDVLVWFFLWMLNIFLIYEHFIDRSRSRSSITKSGLKSLLIAIMAVFIVILLNRFYPETLRFNKAYLTICAIVIMPLLYFCWRKPKIVIRTLPATTFFAYVYLLHEITALKLEQWRFVGDYIGWIHVAGVAFPIEELVFWILLSGLVGSIYFEMYFDNHRA